MFCQTFFFILNIFAFFNGFIGLFFDAFSPFFNPLFVVRVLAWFINALLL